VSAPSAPLVITSPANPRLKALTALRRRRTRETTGLTLVEGFEELQLAWRSGTVPRSLYFCPELMADEAAEMLAELRRQPADQPPGDAELARLQNLDGRDPEIDALLRDSAPRTTWIDRLERLVRLEPTGRATLPEAL